MALLLLLGIGGWLGLVSLVNLVAILHHRQDYQAHQERHKEQLRHRAALRAHHHRIQQNRIQQNLNQDWDPTCVYFSGSVHLPCAVRPLGSCRCGDYCPRQN